MGRGQCCGQSSFHIHALVGFVKSNMDSACQWHLYKIMSHLREGIVNCYETVFDIYVVYKYILLLPGSPQILTKETGQCLCVESYFPCN